ncbi:MAG: hypothetical protein ABL957_07910, partial [Parvularculaceae bacterium]
GRTIFREPAALLGRAGVEATAPLAVAPGTAALWDNRFIIENRGGDPLIVEPFGKGPATAIGEAARLAGCPPEALAGAPAAAGRLIGGGGDIRRFSLAPERFDGKVMRIP